MKPATTFLLAALAACKPDVRMAAPGEEVKLVVMTATYADGSDAMPDVQKSCRFHNRVASAIVLAVPDSSLDTGKSDDVLRLEITTMRGADPQWQGDRSVVMRGRLESGGTATGTFRIEHGEAMGAFTGMSGVCRSLDHIAETMAEEIAAWLKKPAMDSELGD